MRNNIFRVSIPVLAVMAASLMGCTIVHNEGTTPEKVYVKEPPPPPRAEAQTACASDSQWVEGYWAYHADHWVWVDGRCERPPKAGHEWVKPAYEERDGKGVYSEGSWQPAEQARKHREAKKAEPASAGTAQSTAVTPHPGKIEPAPTANIEKPEGSTAVTPHPGKIEPAPTANVGDKDKEVKPHPGKIEPAPTGNINNKVTPHPGKIEPAPTGNINDKVTPHPGKIEPSPTANVGDKDKEVKPHPGKMEPAPTGNINNKVTPHPGNVEPAPTGNINKKVKPHPGTTKVQPVEEPKKKKAGNKTQIKGTADQAEPEGVKAHPGNVSKDTVKTPKQPRVLGTKCTAGPKCNCNGTCDPDESKASCGDCK